MPGKALNIDSRDLVELYSSGKTYQQVADTFGISVMAAHSRIRRAGAGRTKAEAIRIRKVRELAPLIVPVVSDFDEGMSVLALHRKYGVQRSTILRILADGGRQPRSGSAANKIRFRSPEARGRQAIKAHLSMGKGESEFYELLAERGITAERQKIVGNRNIDLAVGNVAVEVHAGLYNPFAPCSRERDRCKELVRAGWHVVFVWTAGRRISGYCADKVVALIEELGGLPAIPGEYRVLSGDGKTAAAGCGDPPEVTFKWSHHRSRY